MSGTPSKVPIDQVEAALLALLNSVMSGAYAAALGATPQNVDIQSLGDRDFNAEGQLVLSPPSLRVLFAGAKYDKLRDNQRLTYEAGIIFHILCYESSLRSKKDERRQTLVLVATLLDQLAGARLALADGSSTSPIGLESVSLLTEQGAVDQLYDVTVVVNGIAQFSGANARFGS